MGETELCDRLTAFCERVFGPGSGVHHLKQLTGGASQQTWAFSYADHDFILRRSEGQDTVASRQGLLNSSQEAKLIRVMGTAGVHVPEICGELTAEDGLGAGFVMRRVRGEALPQKLFRRPEHAAALSVFCEECAEQLARIHLTNPTPVKTGLPTRSPEDRVTQLIARYHELNSPHPVLALSLRWLRDHIPDGGHSAIVHGDFRMGNLLLGDDRLNAVLDWELAHIGDPVSDLAYLCAPCWRFGRYQTPVGGVGQIDDLLLAYEHRTGRSVDRDRFQFWMIFTSTWWAITCLVMFSSWRSGEVRTLERVVIGARASENDIDLLLLLSEAGAFRPVCPIDWPDAYAPEAVGASETQEIATALGEWVTGTIIPGLDGAGLFEARVARNALGIIARRTGLGRYFEARLSQRYQKLQLTPHALAQQLFTEPPCAMSRAISEHLQLSAVETLLTDQPGYVGLAIAKRTWV